MTWPIPDFNTLNGAVAGVLSGLLAVMLLARVVEIGSGIRAHQAENDSLGGGTVFLYVLGFVLTFGLFLVAQSPLLAVISGRQLAGQEATLAWIAVGAAFAVQTIGLAVSFFTRPKPRIPGMRRTVGN